MMNSFWESFAVYGYQKLGNHSPIKNVLEETPVHLFDLSPGELSHKVHVISLHSKESFIDRLFHAQFPLRLAPPAGFPWH